MELFPSHGIVPKPSRGAPCQLHSRGVKSLQRCSTQALPKEQQLRENSTWFDLTQSLCALRICGVGRAKVTGVACPCPHPNPEHPALQGMRQSSFKIIVQQLFKICFAYNSLLFPCPPLSKQFISLHLISPASKTKPLKDHLDLHICGGFFKYILKKSHSRFCEDKMILVNRQLNFRSNLWRRPRITPI